MKETDIPSFDFSDESPVHLASAKTLSIDLSTLFASDAYSSGTFDLSAISSSSLGRLLDALPIPVLLIDQWGQIGFANRACAKICTDYKKIQGIPFADLVPRPNDAYKAQELMQKTQALIERAFETRQPQLSEAILEIEKKKIWARLHLRSVKLGLDRYILLIIEDLTSDKKELVLTQRHDEKYRKANFGLGKRVDELNDEVRRLREKLELEIGQHLRTCGSLSDQKQRFDELWDRGPIALAVIGKEGRVQRVNPRFTEMFGYDVTDLENNPGWIARSGHHTDRVLNSVTDWIDALGLERDNVSVSRTFAVTRKDGQTHNVTLTPVRTRDEELLLIFERVGGSAKE
jgi:PAS domain S-box-containing protein